MRCSRCHERRRVQSADEKGRVVLTFHSMVDPRSRLGRRSIPCLETMSKPRSIPALKSVTDNPL